MIKTFLFFGVVFFLSACSGVPKDPPSVALTAPTSNSGLASSGVQEESIGVDTNSGSTLDCDGDGLSDRAELVFLANPCKIDTDGDGLTDQFEIENGYPYLKPDEKDTDKNGIDDFNDDADKDGMSNGEEMKADLSPLTGDFDGDGLNDQLEREYGSDVKLIDTDSDGTDDKNEYDWKLDPRYDDSDKVGVYPMHHMVGDVDIWIYARGTPKEVLSSVNAGFVKSPNHVMAQGFTTIHYEGGILDPTYVEKIAISQTGSVKNYIPVFKIEGTSLLDGGTLSEEDTMRLFSFVLSSKDRETNSGTIYEHDMGDTIMWLGFITDVDAFAKEEEARLEKIFAQ